MSRLSRRELLSAGLVISTSSLVARSAWARAAALLARAPEAGSAGALAAAPGAIAPREQLLFDFGWKFRFGNGNDPARDLGFGMNQEVFAKTGDLKFARVGYDDSKWRTLNLPHDWAVELPFVWDEELMSHGYKPLGRRYPETSVGWYRREFEIPASDAGRRISVEFDGAVRDVMTFVNGCFIGRNDTATRPFASTSPTSSPSAKRTASWCAWTRAMATAGSTKAREFTGTCGSRRPARCTWAGGRARSAHR